MIINRRVCSILLTCLAWGYHLSRGCCFSCCRGFAVLFFLLFLQFLLFLLLLGAPLLLLQMLLTFMFHLLIGPHLFSLLFFYSALALACCAGRHCW
jgi:hypothetical protein